MDLMTYIEPFMHSGAVYPVTFLVSLLDAFLPIVPSEGTVIGASVFAAVTAVAAFTSHSSPRP